MKLNPEKSAFEVGSGKFLEFMVSNRGIEINPDKIKAIEDITAVDNKKNNFSLTPECQQALEELKQYLSSPPLLHTLKADDQLYLYLAVSEVAVNGVLVREEEESGALHTKAAQFNFSEDGTLFRRTFNGPLAICLRPRDSEYVMREIHEGTCRNHSDAESLVRKIIRAGYY
nr:uncharacterized protein LOC117275929 [Nicotiana tomentosiformis]